MKIYLDSVGCRLNQAEIEAYARQFHQRGHDLVESPELADLAVINTCAVTAAAASDSRQKVRNAERARRNGHHAACEHAAGGGTVVTGCWSTLRPREAASLPGVSRVVPNAAKDRLVVELLGLPLEEFEVEPLERVPVPGARSRTRAFIKVQDGCDNRCAFCVTALARGQGRSRAAAEILAEIQAVSCHGGQEASTAVQEAVLTGVHLGSWGQDLQPRMKLGDLVKLVLDETDLPRLRLSSLEPWDLDEAFFELWQNQRLCRHLHLPVQSGCAAILQRMQRKTTPETYARLVENARSLIPGLAITTDVIVGFPGEGDKEFEESLEFVKEIYFAGGHVFSYSSRPGTAASRMDGQVPTVVRRERSRRMREALADSAQAFRSGFVGQVLPVLWESAVEFGPQGWEMSGLTDNYLRVKATAQEGLWNQVKLVKLTGLDKDSVLGTLNL